MTNPRRAARQQARQDKQMDKQVQKYAKQIKSGALNIDELSPGTVSPEMRKAASLVESQNYSDRMRGDTETRNKIGMKDFQKKGGISAKGKAFFNPALSKSSKKK